MNIIQKLLVIDIETLSTKDNALVLSIGIMSCSYNLTTNTKFDVSFLYDVLPVKYQSDVLKRDIDDGTVAWWNGDRISAKARDEAFKRVDEPLNETLHKSELERSLKTLKAFVDARKDHDIYGHGPEFDIRILNNIYQQLFGEDFVKSFRRVLSLRNEVLLCLNLANEDIFETTRNKYPDMVSHHALNDCAFELDVAIRSKELQFKARELILGYKPVPVEAPTGPAPVPVDDSEWPVVIHF